jgi:hypothetical protein
MTVPLPAVSSQKRSTPNTVQQQAASVNKPLLTQSNFFIQNDYSSNNNTLSSSARSATVLSHRHNTRKLALPEMANGLSPEPMKTPEM